MAYNLETFCPEAWSQLEIDAQGDFKICCLANFDKDFGMALDEEGKVMNVMTHSFEDAINSVTHKEHRCQMSNNRLPERCRNCLDSEKTTISRTNPKGLSKRQRVLYETAPSIKEYATIDTVSGTTEKDGTITKPKIVNLDIRFGNLCNQKCIMCSPQHSNQWYDDWIAISEEGSKTLYNREKTLYKKADAKSFEFYKDKHGKTKMHGTPSWWETERWWSMFDGIANDLRYIYFTGGEPLVVPAMQKCLDILIEKNLAKNIQLRYDTNLSVINDKVISKWKHFKKVYLCVSLDDTNERYNLIRFPGNFDRIYENIKTLKNNKIDIHYISSCIGNQSIYAVDRLTKLSQELETPVYFRFIEGPNWLDIRNWPREAKLEIISNLKSTQGNNEYRHWSNAQIKLLEKYMDTHQPDYLKEMVRVMDILDIKRGTDWKKTFPELVDLIRKYCPYIEI